MTSRLATHTYHSLDYYWRLLKALIALIDRNLSHAAIAAALNDKGISSPTGNSFSLSPYALAEKLSCSISMDRARPCRTPPWG